MDTNLGHIAERYLDSVLSTSESRSAEENAYRQLKRMILSFEFRPGDPLPEQAIGDRFGMSRTPVRHAIKRLRQEGLVNVIPNRGAFVAPLMLQDMLEIYTIREILEGEAAARATNRGGIPSEKLEELRGQIEALEVDRPSEADVALLAKLDAELHRTILRGSGIRRLESIVQMLNNQALRMFLVGITRRYPETIKENLRIIEAITSGQPEEAKHFIQEHIQSARAMMTTML